MSAFKIQGHPSEKKYRRRNLLFAGLGLLAASALTFFGIRYWKKQRKTESPATDTPGFEEHAPGMQQQAPPPPKENATKPPKGAPFTPPKTAPRNTGTKKTGTKASGATTESKKQEQKTAAQNTGGNAAFKTAEELLKEKIKSRFSPLVIAKGIQQAYLSGDFTKAYKFLRLITDKAHYVTINSLFTMLLTGRGRKTIVSALLDAFRTERQRTLLQQAFKGIGLVYRNGKWALSGLEGTQDLLITLVPTQVWNHPRTSVPVPAKMILGRFITSRGEYSVFENQNIHFIVKSSAVQRLTH